MSLLALVDCNNFFVSCERAFAPKLQGRPVIVLSNNDGCVISRSDEAKALGIPMGAPFFEVRALALEQRVAVISANHELYVDMSRRVSCVLARHAQELEAYSIDESFLRLPDGKNEDWARTVRSEVGRWTGLPVAVGLGPTKVLAKLAADLAKKKGGVFSLCDETARAEVLAGLPLTSVWGLAAASARRLGVYGLRTAQDLAQARDGAVRDAVGVMGLKLAAELRGQACLPLNHAPAPRQSLTVSRSFAEAVEGRDPLWSAVATFACQAGERLRRHGLAAGELRVFVGWRQDGQAESEAGCEKLTPASATPALLEAARAAFERVFREDRRYKKAGVILSALGPADPGQGSLFDDAKARRQDRLMGALDRVNADLGTGTLRYAGAGLSRGWTPRCENRSPCYTTRWQDLPRVRA